MPTAKIQRSLGSEIKNTFALGLPFIASQLIYACSGFISTAMLAQLGEEAMAASVLISTIWLTLSVFFFGLLNAISVLVAHQFGASNHKMIDKIMGQAYLLGILLTLLIIASLCFVPTFLTFSNQSETILILSQQYLQALFWMIPGLVTLLICEQFLMGIGRAKTVLKISLLVVPIEIPLIYVLIFGKGGLPKCGVSGVGYGFAITYTLSAIGLILYLLKSKISRTYSLFQGMKKFDGSLIKEFISVGLPIGFMSVIEVSTFAAATFFIAQFGTTLLAAHQIVLQYLSFTITLVFAMAQAVSIRVGHAVGRHDRAGIHWAAYVGMLTNFFCVLPISAAFYFFPTFFLRVDINIHDPANALLVHRASSLLLIASVLLLFDNFRIISAGALRGLKDTQFSMYLSCIGFWGVGLCFAYIFGFTLQGGGIGIWWGLTLGIASGALITVWRLRYQLERLDARRLKKLSGN